MSYQRKFWAYAALALGSGSLAGAIIGKNVPASGGVENPAVVLPLLFLLVCALIVPAWLWWQKTDDLQKQGQLQSWWWGGNFGALLMLVTVVTLTGRHSDFSLGATYMFMAEFAGTVVVFLIWKWRGRGAAE